MTVDEIFQKMDPRPFYDRVYEPLFNKLCGKGKYRNNQLYHIAFMLGIHLNKCDKIERGSSKKDIYPLNMWAPEHLKNEIYYLLFKRSKDWGVSWSDLDNADEDFWMMFSKLFSDNMDGYANSGLAYIQQKMDEDPVFFESPFCLIDLLISVSEENKL